MTARLFSLCALLSGWALSAAAQTPPTCAGHYEIIRSDSIKPGKLDVFLKAVKDQQAWYTAHGLKDKILLGRIIVPSVDTSAFSEGLALTVHTDMTSLKAQPQEAQDAGWKAFVAEYQDSSSVVNQAIVCLSDAPH